MYSGSFVLYGRFINVIDVMHILISHLNFIPLGILSKLLRDANAFCSVKQYLLGTLPNPLEPVIVDAIAERGRSPSETLSDVSATKF
jgi:hypothetical protein